MNQKIPELNDSDLGKWVWQNLVPKSGQSESVQGELLRANEKLRDEAQRNGNMNWDTGFEILIDFLDETLCSKKRLFRDPTKSLRHDLARLKNYDDPYVEDDLYDRIEKRIFIFIRKHRNPIPKPYNPDLKR
jgi:hypothetical protein